MAESQSSLFRELREHRHTILQLAKRDFKSRYAGSVLGLVWAFLQPLAMMLILWFVFSYGLKAQPVEPGVSFIAWFFSASIAWNFFQDGNLVACSAVNDYAFLVKKVNFKVRLLPLIKILSATVLHAVFLVILALVLIVNGYRPTAHWLQVGYYFAGATLLLLGIGWMTSALNVFAKDVQQVLGISLQFGFWVTPIIWNHKMLPEHLRIIAKLNPVFYITEGYRNSFVHGLSIKEHGVNSGLFFWIVTASMLVLGHYVFNRLRPHFGDVL